MRPSLHGPVSSQNKAASVVSRCVRFKRNEFSHGEIARTMRDLLFDGSEFPGTAAKLAAKKHRKSFRNLSIKGLKLE